MRTISALVVVEDGQALSSSSCLDLASQAPSANVTVSMKRCTKAYPRLQAEGFDRMSNRIRLISADLRRGGGLQAAVGRARLDRYTSAWRPKPRQKPTLALSTSREDDPTVPAGLRGPSLRLKARGFTISDGDTNPDH